MLQQDLMEESQITQKPETLEDEDIELTLLQKVCDLKLGRVQG